jgi:glutamate-ammonia-ligase adenylyltransferase
VQNPLNDPFWTGILERFAGTTEQAVMRSRLEPLALASRALPPESQPMAADILVSLAHGAPFCCRLLARDRDALTWLTDDSVWRGPRAESAMAAHLELHIADAADEPDWMRGARRFRARELSRIAARDLLGLSDVPEATAELSHLADTCLTAALEFARHSLVERLGEPEGTGDVAVIGLGKLGAEELNFSSDIDILFLYAQDGETHGGRTACTNLEWAVACAQTVTRLLDRPTEDGRLFRVDLRLRPDGDTGPLAFTPEWAERYYTRKGQPWERVALLRARTCAGSEELGRAFMAVIEPFVYRREIDTEIVASLRDVKRQISEALLSEQRAGFDVKLGRGGIRELEFFVQTLQALNAGRDPRLRDHRTFALIDALAASGLIGEKLRRLLVEDYAFLRRVEHRLQMVDDQQVHRVPRDPSEREHLASRLGFATLDELDEHLERVREAIHLLFSSLFAAEETEEEARLRDELAGQLVTFLDGIDYTAARAVLGHWPSDHLRRETVEAIADGFALLESVTDQQPVAASIVDRSDGTLDLRLAGHDRTGLASVSTGVLTGAGLDIEEGRLFTVPAQRHAGRTVGARAVQYLRVRPAGGELSSDQSERLLSDLGTLARRWLHGDTDEVRAEINSRWVDRMRASHAAAPERIQDLDLEIDNHSDPEATVVALWAEDAPGFLYGFTQALAMRGINVHQTRIRTEGGRVLDRFHVTNRHGRKIIVGAARHELGVIAVLIKAFTHFLSRAADPARALTQFDALLDRLHREGESAIIESLATEPLMTTLATVLGSGAYLFEDFLRLKPAHMLPVLQAVSAGTRRSAVELVTDGTVADRRKRLIAARDAEIFRIDCDHLTHHGSLEQLSEALTRLARDVITEAWRIALDEVGDTLGTPIAPDGSPIPWAIFALGKFGGRELGVASDLELQVVYGQDGVTTGPGVASAGEFFERAVQALRRNMPTRRDGIFELDLRLRPYGGPGPLASAFSSFARYYAVGGGAAAFERQALIRLAACCGDPALTERVLAVRDEFTYGPEPFPLGEVLALRRKQIAELTRPGQTHLKYSPGGLVEVEYAVQYLQVSHGRKNPILRQPNTLLGLDGLQKTGLVATDEAEVLRAAYRSLRRVIDALRLERGNARDLALPTRGSRDTRVLARRLDTDPDALCDEIAGHMAAVADLYRVRFGEV